ncbi:hypothetical protein [Streptomyces sp. NPDC002490]|uniref:hypothetical protein n=1 Tax=Streptomyces sp. NPDC002490 TaxID=3154416 RepID=UPI00331CE6A4
MTAAVPAAGPGWVRDRCWLYCGREGLPVQWIGPVRVPLGEAPMFACAACLDQLAALAERAIGEADRAALVPR